MASAPPRDREPTPGWLRRLALAGAIGITGTTVLAPRLGFLLLVVLELVVVACLAGEGAADIPDRAAPVDGAEEVLAGDPSVGRHRAPRQPGPGPRPP